MRPGPLLALAGLLLVVCRPGTPARRARSAAPGGAPAVGDGSRAAVVRAQRPSAPPGAPGLRPSVSAPSPCRGPDGTSRRLAWYIAQYTAPGPDRPPQFDSARATFGLPRVPAESVVVVTRPAVCRAAAAAYARALPRSAGRVSGRVYVIRAGRTFTVYDPAYYYRTPGIGSMVIFDARWRRLTLLAG